MNKRIMGWNVSDTKASFKHRSLELIVQTRPSLSFELRAGTSMSEWQIQPKEDSVEANTPAPDLDEAYSRLDDFIVCYPQKYPWPFSYQLDVRVQPSDENLLVAELWLSVQTSMLECNPQLSLVPTSPNTPWSSHGHFLYSGDRRSALAIHPLDKDDCRIHADRSSSLEQLELFGRFMEKGVIRRGRLLFIGSASPIPEKQMIDLYKRFADSSLPLTA
jgi:hypothetical protein